MVQTEIKLEGFAELDKALATLPYEIGVKVLQNAVSSAILPAFKAVKSAAPIGNEQARNPDSKSGKIKLKYGKLRDNIKKRKTKTYADNSKSAYISTGNAFWGFFLEHGTRYIPATHWFSRAFESSQDAMLSKLKADIARGIDKKFREMTKR